MSGLTISPPGFADLWSRRHFRRGPRLPQRRLLHRPRQHSRRGRHQANVQFVTGDIRLDHYTSIGDFFFKTSMLAEERQNGTVVTHNSTGWAPSLCATRANSPTIRSPCSASTPAAAFTPPSTRSPTTAIPIASPIARPSPARPLAAPPSGSTTTKRWNLMAGADADRLEGTSTDHVVPTGQRVGGGTQLQHGLCAGRCHARTRQALRRPAPQLRRRGQQFRQSQRRLRRRQEESARPRQRLPQFPRPHVE